MIRSIFVMTMALSVLANLGACARMNPAAHVYCEVERPISWSGKDTDLTIAQVKEHNSVYKSLCPTSH